MTVRSTGYDGRHVPSRAAGGGAPGGRRRSAYLTLAELTPDSAQTHSNLGATLYYLGRREEALRSFERALALDPDLEAARAGVQGLSGVEAETRDTNAGP